MVVVEGDLPLGEIIPVLITGAMAYDLSGVAVGVGGGVDISLEQV